jgi:hypothetical protein
MNLILGIIVGILLTIGTAFMADAFRFWRGLEATSRLPRPLPLTDLEWLAAAIRSACRRPSRC